MNDEIVMKTMKQVAVTRFGVLMFVLAMVIGVALDRWVIDRFLPLPSTEVWGNVLEKQKRVEKKRAVPEDYDLKGLKIPKEDIISVLPIDAIPALTRPEVVGAKAAKFLGDQDRVLGVVVDGVSRAYPVNVLNWHEIVNDELGKVNVGIIYCPLCDSFSVVDREIVKGKVLSFGVSGMLYNSNVMMYDRERKGLWSQVYMQALSGKYAGKSLKHLPFEVTHWGAWKKKHPKTDVMTFETGHGRNYTKNPYANYFKHDEIRDKFAPKHRDKRMKNKEMVIGVRYAGVVRAYPVKTMMKGMKDGVFAWKIDGKVFEVGIGDGGKTVAVKSFPEGAVVVKTFWYAWAAFHPKTEIYGAE